MKLSIDSISLYLTQRCFDIHTYNNIIYTFFRNVKRDVFRDEKFSRKNHFRLHIVILSLPSHDRYSVQTCTFLSHWRLYPGLCVLVLLSPLFARGIKHGCAQGDGRRCVCTHGTAGGNTESHFLAKNAIQYVATALFATLFCSLSFPLSLPFLLPPLVIYKTFIVIPREKHYGYCCGDTEIPISI